MTERILALDMAGPEFAEAVERLGREGESATLVKDGVPVARIIPIDTPRRMTGAEFADLWERLPHMSREEADEFAADIEEGRRLLLPPRDVWQE